MDNESPEVIERQMHETRQSLTDKVAALETQVTGTIQSATSAVQETIESVKSAVQDTVSSVKQTVGDVKDTVEDSVSSVQEGVMSAFDVSAQVNRRPWAMVGGAAAAGFITGLLVFRKSESGGGLASLFSSTSPYAPYPTTPQTTPPHGYVPQPAEPPARREEPRKPGFLDELFEMAGQEAKKLGEAALASVVASLQRNINDELPKMIDSTVQHFTDKATHASSPAPAGRRTNGPHAPTM